MEMLGKGYADVVIVDLADTAKRMRQLRSASSIWIPENNTALRAWRIAANIAKLPERSI